MGKVPKDYLKKCKKDPSWCSHLSKTVLSKLTEAELIKLNCGKQPGNVCDTLMNKLEALCKKEFPKKVIECTDAKVLIHTMTGCGGGDKRAANLGTEGSSNMELHLGIGAVLLIFIVGAIAAYFYFFGGKKDGKAAGNCPCKGAAGKSKSKMAGKSKLGSRKSQASKRSSRKASQRSKMSGASKGTKSRMSCKKK